MFINMKLIIIPQNEIASFTAQTSDESALVPSPVGDYSATLPYEVLADPVHQAFFQQRRTEGHNIWSFEQIEYNKWEAFCNGLLSSAVGQRINAATATNGYASFVGALVSENAVSANALIPFVSAVYQLTNPEKTEFNALVDKYGVELTKFEGV